MCLENAFPHTSKWPPERSVVKFSDQDKQWDENLSKPPKSHRNAIAKMTTITTTTTTSGRNPNAFNLVDLER
eukprot:5482388-Amphidinium_carterae.1